jgi:hypothetical protein
MRVRIQKGGNISRYHHRHSSNRATRCGNAHDQSQPLIRSLPLTDRPISKTRVR